jgi:hypothetical protein
MESWPALAWTPQMFAERFGDRKVIVAYGRGWRKMQMGALVNLLAQAQVPSRRLGPSPYTLYLRNRHIGVDFPELLSDFTISAYFTPNWLAQWPLKESLPFAKKELIELFIGPPGAMGLKIHQDAHMTHAWVSQVFGQKRVWAVSPEARCSVYPDPANKFHSMLNDLEDPDPERFPLFDRSEVISTLLSPGETIFIPAGWWHTAECVTASISLSGNFANETNFAEFRQTMVLPRFQKTPGIAGRACNHGLLGLHELTCRVRRL